MKKKRRKKAVAMPWGKNYRGRDDAFYITKFRTLHPEQVEEIRNEIKKEYPYTNAKTIEKHVDHEILPMILEESTKNYGGGGHAIYLSGINLDEKEIYPIGVRGSSFGDYTVETLHEYLELLPSLDKQIIKMVFGFHPYDREHSRAEVGELLGIPRSTINRKIDKILVMLGEGLIEENAG